jgi:hypothetical protein
MQNPGALTPRLLQSGQDSETQPVNHWFPYHYKKRFDFGKSFGKTYTLGLKEASTARTKGFLKNKRAHFGLSLSKRS